MNKKALEIWADALESDEYTKTRFVLAEGDTEVCSFCAWGVLINEYALAHGKSYEQVMDESKRLYIPSSVRNWADVPACVTIEPGLTVMAANDAKGWSFKRIGQAIRKLAEKGK